MVCCVLVKVSIHILFFNFCIKVNRLIFLINLCGIFRMDSSCEDNHRAFAISNKDFTANEFIDEGQSKNTKKASVGIIKTLR